MCDYLHLHAVVKFDEFLTCVHAFVFVQCVWLCCCALYVCVSSHSTQDLKQNALQR